MLDEVSSIPLICAQYALNEKSPDKTLSDLVEAYLDARSEGALLFLASSGFEQVPSSPGYLVKPMRGRNYYVPFNLASMFPEGKMLDEIDDLLMACRLDKSGDICLSGSATFLGKLISITDLDFCEYYFDDLETAKVRLGEKSRDELLPCLLRVKSGEHVEHRPFSDLVLFLERVKLHIDSETEFEQVKLDYVAAPASFGPIAVTNLILSTDIQSAAPRNANSSFQYQEIVICEQTRRPHRSLKSAEDLGRYMNWLRDECRKLIEAGAKDLPASGKDLVKALKRALSWYLIAGMEEPVKDIVSVLGNPVMGKISVAARGQELERMLEPIDHAATEKLRQLIGANGAGNQIAADELQNFYNLAHALAENLVQEMDSLSVA